MRLDSTAKVNLAKPVSVMLAKNERRHKMALDLQYEKKEQIPAGFEDLYTEKNVENAEGEMIPTFFLTEINGMKTEQDTSKLETALKAERAEHGETKKKLKVWDGKDPEKLAENDALLEEYKAKIEAMEGTDEDLDIRVAKLVEARIAKQTAPLERTIEELTTKEKEATGKVSELNALIEDREMRDRVREAATFAKVNPTAMPDIEMMAKHYLEKDETSGNLITKDGLEGIAPGLSMKQFFEDIKAHRPHWYPVSQGAGTVDVTNPRKIVGFDGDNPWSNEHWSITGQGAVVREHGMDMAEKLARAMGTKAIGGERPKPPSND